MKDRQTDCCALPKLMPAAQIPCVEMVALMALADLERLEGPWLEELRNGDPETVAITLRLLMAHMVSTSKRLRGAMVLDRLDAEERATAHKAVGLSESGPTL